MSDPVQSVQDAPTEPLCAICGHAEGWHTWYQADGPCTKVYCQCKQFVSPPTKSTDP